MYFLFKNFKQVNLRIVQTSILRIVGKQIRETRNST